MHQFSGVVQIMYFFGDIWDKVALNLVLVQNLKIDAGTAPSNGAILNEFNEHY